MEATKQLLGRSSEGGSSQIHLTVVPDGFETLQLAQVHRGQLTLHFLQTIPSSFPGTGANPNWVPPQLKQGTSVVRPLHLTHSRTIRPGSLPTSQRTACGAASNVVSESIKPWFRAR